MINNEYVNQAIDYILHHASEELSVEKIASHCNFSKYHFSRLFKMETGEGIGEFVRRVKMEQSALRLKVERNRRVTDIGSEYGYSSSNYSVAFKQHHGVSPVVFRRDILKKSLKNPASGTAVPLEDFSACDSKITIQTLDDFTVVYQRYKGSYRDLSQHWGEFQEKYSRYTTPQTLFLERTYDDPSITEADGCLYDIYMTVPENCDLENTCVIQGGKFAVYHFYGPVGQIYTAYQSIFNVWLPQSGNKIDERYGFDLYRMVDCDSMNMKIDICVPIK